LNEFISEGIELLVTCDTGISAHDAINYAKERGLRVVVTDHHDLPVSLPKADVLINPKMLPDDHPLATLPGVGVAYKLIEALYSEVGHEDELEEFLDLVALGLVADVASLVRDARYLLQLGLKRLRETSRLGLQAIYERVELNPERITEVEIGYVIAPRLNALGRLGDANPVVEFLTTESGSKAAVTATMLEELNAQRKLMSDQVFGGALAEVERHPEYLSEAAIVLSNPFWPAGVVGIVASRLEDRYKKPVVLLTVSDDGMARGSARSVEGCDISKAIQGCEDLLIGFGGHPMAAGMSLPEENIGLFRKRLSGEVEKQLGVEAVEPELVIDQFVSLDEIGIPLVQEVNRLAPFGSGNPPVLFGTRDLVVISDTYLGRDGDHRKLVVEDLEGKRQTVLWWQSGSLEKPKGKFDLAFTARENFFQGEIQLQVVLEDFREKGEPVEETSSQIEITDLRGVPDPNKKLGELLQADGNLRVWGEGTIPSDLRGLVVGRDKLTASESLAIWTVPPSIRLLESLVDKTGARKVILFSQRPEVEEIGDFLRRLAGLVKFALNKRGEHFSLVDLAVATGQTELVIRQGLAWLEAKGNISVKYFEGANLEIKSERSPQTEMLSVDAIEQDLKSLLLETKLFRDYFISGDMDSLKSLLEKGRKS
jgi:single-stranded-DNA-specific exonuclease